MVEDILIFSVYEITRHLKQVIETTIEPLYVTGEISNFTHHSSGHMYFNLKDPNATIRCTFFKNVNYKLDFIPEEGMQVVVYGNITIFEKAGQYNLNVQTMSPHGQGDLARQFELLKSKLNEEGLFLPEHKKPIPNFPEHIGIVTSPTGAALQDIMNILRRRFPVEVSVFPALVQGTEAAAQLRQGVEYFNSEGAVDVIIITRGGGSQEDLWAFNDEALARAIFSSRIPVISAVGHEIDFTICDFVADLRAPTPSAAAELVVPDKADLLAILEVYEKRLQAYVRETLNAYRQRLESSTAHMSSISPQSLINNYNQSIDYLENSLRSSTKILEHFAGTLQTTERSFLSISQQKLQNMIQIKTMDLGYKEKELANSLELVLRNAKERLNLASVFMAEASPEKRLKQGYSIVRKDGKIVRNISHISPSDLINIDFCDGVATANVQDTKTNE